MKKVTLKKALKNAKKIRDKKWNIALCEKKEWFITKNGIPYLHIISDGILDEKEIEKRVEKIIKLLNKKGGGKDRK